MEIKVVMFKDNKMLRESLQRLVDTAEGIASARTFSDANKPVCDGQYSHP